MWVTKANSHARRFELWLPFTASAIGVMEAVLPQVHNFPIKQALARINIESIWECHTIYFTDRIDRFNLLENGVPHHFFPVSFRQRRHSQTFARQWSIDALRHLVLHPPDVVGLHGGYGLFTHTVARICHLRGIPYFVALGGWPVPRIAAQRRCLQEAACVVTFTDRQRRWMATEGIYTGNNMRVWTVGVDTTLFYVGAYKVPNESPRLLYVGRIVDNKGAMEAIQALRAIRNEFSNATLVVVGSHQDERFLARVRAYLQEYSLSEAVRLIGAVPYTELPEWYRGADLFIFPSPLESFGFVLIESMACGTPAVVLRGSEGPEEIIANGTDGVITDLPNLATEVIRLLNDPARVAQMSTQAAEKIRTLYPIERTTRELTEILDLCMMARH